MAQVCEKQNIDLMDVYNTVPFNYIKDTYDYTHPTEEFISEVWSPMISEFIKENCHFSYYLKKCDSCLARQEIEYENLFEDNAENHGMVCTYDLETRKFKLKESEWYAYSLISVENLSTLRFAFSEKSLSNAWSYFFYDENDVCVGGGNMAIGLVDVYVEVPKGASYVGVLYNPNNVYGVYGSS